METKQVSKKESQLILSLLKDSFKDRTYIEKKHQWEFYDGEKVVFKLRMPITVAPSRREDLVSDGHLNYVLLLIRSGAAAVGYFSQGENIEHKVFRAYMVRKQQGKSQIKHLKTKGKSRAGSRIRLAETLRFFEEINERLSVYFNSYPIHRIGISCPATLIPYLYQSKEKTPFEKNDARIMTIPTHIVNPTYEILNKANRFLLQGELKYSEEGKKYLENIPGTVNEEAADDDDNW